MNNPGRLILLQLVKPDIPCNILSLVNNKHQGVLNILLVIMQKLIFRGNQVIKQLLPGDLLIKYYWTHRLAAYRHTLLSRPW